MYLVTYRDDAALTRETHHRIVRARSARRRVDHQENVLVLHKRNRRGREHGVNVLLSEDLLQTRKGEAGELAADEVRAVLSKKYI